MIDLSPLWLTCRLALITTVILFVAGLPLAWWIAYGRFRGKALIEAVISLPLVLPPSVLGFYLLLAFSPANGFGRWLDHYFNLRLVFSFPGLVVASVLYSLPFMIQPLQAGFKALPLSLREAAYTLGKSRLQTLVEVLLPNMRAALVTGIMLSFAHTVGEFGVVLMIGGNIPHQTRLASLAIYDEMQALNYHTANTYAMILLTCSFVILLTVYLINHRFATTSLHDQV